VIIEEQTIGAVTVLSIKGNITLGEGDKLLRDKIRSLILRDRKQIVLDLAGVSYVDSSGFGEIYLGFTIVVRSGGNLVLCNLTKRIADLLIITKMITVSEVYESVNEAVRRFQSATFEIACPVCNPKQWLNYPGHAGRATCARCDVEFAFPAASLTEANRDTSEPSSGWTVPIHSVSWRTYATEGTATDEVRLAPGEPAVITIEGRLDLFTFEVVETAWRAIPRPCCVLFDTTPVTASSPAGWDKLKALCGSREGDQRTLILAPVNARGIGGTIATNYNRAIVELRGRARGPLRLTTTIRTRPA